MSIFRPISLQRLQSPDQLDETVRVVDPKAWLALAGLGILLAAAVVWAIVGTVSTTVPGQGVLIPSAGIGSIATLDAGQLTEISVKVNDFVEPGQVIAQLIPSVGANPVPVTAPFAGRVIEIRQRQGDVVNRGTVLVTVELGAEGAHELEALVFVPATLGAQIKQGMSAQVSPVGIESEQYGFLMGTVRNVSNYPASRERILELLEDEDLVQEFVKNGPPLEVHIELIPATTPSGYQWSTPTGPPVTISAGTLASAQVIVNQQHPISLILPQAQ